LLVKVFLPKADIRHQLELYINNMQSSGRLLYDNYFRAKYYDEQIDEELMLFIYRGKRFKLIQTWEVRGICESKYWTDDLEYEGGVRDWLKCKLDTDDETDWVLDYRLQETNKKASDSKSEDEYKMVKELLKNYKINKARIAVSNKNDVASLLEKMVFLDKCIDTLDKEAKYIITNIYIKGVSLKNTGDKYGYSKAGVQYKRDRAIKILEMLFN